MSDRKHLIILGIRGLPACHGGFESFAENLSLYLVSQGWEVTVYCQQDGGGAITKGSWSGVNLINIPVKVKGALGTILFDLKAAFHATSQEGIILTLGYNTAVFNIVQRIKGQVNIINMDGIEWRRDKWGAVAKTWFWINERIGCWVGNHLVADHPQIKNHLATRVRSSKITMIPYGGAEVCNAEVEPLQTYGLTPGKFSVIIARPEPENSVLEIVSAFSKRVRGHTLVVLGNFQPASNHFHRAVMKVASDEVVFPGAIYDSRVVESLRFYCRFYLHGHRVGGTNPSLVEALGAGCAVIAQDNSFNRWVAGESASYFEAEADCANLFDRLLDDGFDISTMKSGSLQRFHERFTWPEVLGEYEQLLRQWYPKL